MGGFSSSSSRHSGGDLKFGRLAGRVGLENLGNTCFMNAGLQCLSHVEPFAAFFLTGRYKQEVNRDSSLGCKGELADAFADLQRALWQSERPAVSPQGLMRQLAQFRPDLFEGYEQQDVQEFLAFCLDGLHEDLNRISRRPAPLTAEEEENDERLAADQGEEFMAALSWMRYLETGRSFMVDLMQGQLRSSLTCSVCGHRSRRFEPFLYLSLPVSWEMCNVTDALQEYLAEEQLTGDDQWFCERCKRKVDARKKIDLWELPPVLVVHLKRFEFDAASERFRKIGHLLSAPLTLDLSEYCSSEQAQGARYEVTCVANHKGRFGSGHYTAVCCVGERFFEFDDAEVRALAPHAEVVGPHAYVLFLVRRSEVDGCFHAGHRAPLLRRQSVASPELWPQRASMADQQQMLETLSSRQRAAPSRESAASKETVYLMRLPSLRSSSIIIPGGEQAPASAASAARRPQAAPWCCAGVSDLLALLRPPG